MRPMELKSNQMPSMSSMTFDRHFTLLEHCTVYINPQCHPVIFPEGISDDEFTRT